MNAETPTPEVTSKRIISILEETGHLLTPFGRPNPYKVEVGALGLRPGLKDLEDPAIEMALMSYQDFHARHMSSYIAKYYPGRVEPVIKIDGKVGPAMLEVFSCDRCKTPDVGPAAEIQAAGVGNWKGCHGIGPNFHRVSIHVDRRYMPSHLKSTFDSQIIPAVVKAMRQMGLDPVFDNSAMPVNINFSWVPSSNGWIGLAIVSNNETCSSSPIWCQYLATFIGDLSKWIRLLLHELGHNCGMGHNSRGGIMNAYLEDGPHTWIGDPSESLMRSRFGGVEFKPDDGPGPGPGPDPEPPQEYFEGVYRLYKGGDLYLDGQRVELVGPNFKMRLAHKIEL